MADDDNERIINAASGFWPTYETSGVHYYLLITTIVLGVLDVVLIFIIIFGYCKYVRRKGGAGEMKFVEKMDSPTGTGASEKHNSRPLATVSEEQEISTINLPKMRKRSMTFSETDEECRKYREGLVNSYILDEKEESDESEKRSRKKSVVTFVGVE